MKKLISITLIAMIGFTQVSFAQDEHDQGRHEERGRTNHSQDARDPERNAPRGSAPDRRDEFEYGARGPEWHRGGRVPPTYRERQYVVDDWQAHNLRRPPRGYHWVQVGGDYVLVAAATGVIADLLLNH
jgi:Ni/Co efflux regulator RcnB